MLFISNLKTKTTFIIRPSGTEPKIKLYCAVKGETEEEANELIKLLKEDKQNYKNNKTASNAIIKQ